MEPRRMRVRVSGVVQGVCYRATTSEQADALGLCGWVRNRADGSVELEAEGPIDRLEDLIRWCRRGPPAAQVDEVAVEWLDATGADRGFRVRR